jgi:hypothetical protein
MVKNYISNINKLMESTGDFEEGLVYYISKMKTTATAKLAEELSKDPSDQNLRIIGQSEGILEVLNDISDVYSEYSKSIENLFKEGDNNG